MTSPVMPNIKNVVFLMLENRSLDNLLGWLYTDRSPLHFFPEHDRSPYDGLVAGKYKNPSYTWARAVKEYDVVPVPSSVDAKDRDRVPAYDPCEELRTKGWNGVMNQLFGDQNEIGKLPAPPGQPRMRGFLQDYYARYMAAWQGIDILWTYTAGQLHVINSLAFGHAVSDRWFCSVPSQTNPNRAFSLCGTSLGRESNSNIWAVEQFDVPTIFNALADAGKSWGLYFFDIWKEGKSYTEYTFPHVSRAPRGEIGPMKRFFDHAVAGTLPAFTYLEPKWGYGKGVFFTQGNDYHPPTHLAPGEAFLGQVYNAVRSSPNWGQTLFIVTFDEHGGTYDHVAPKWGATNPDGKKGASGFDFDLFGVRVPTILVSPYIQPQTVFRSPTDVPFDHTSFIKTLLLWAGVEPASADFGQRMPLAPTFDGVLSSSRVDNSQQLPPFGKHPLVAAPPASSLDERPAGSTRPLNAWFEGVSFAAARAILTQHESLDQIRRAIADYKRDPAGFEAGLC